VRRALLLTLVPLVMLAGCGGGDGEKAPTASGFEFTTSDVAPGQPIDARYTCAGDDVSPLLTWLGVPAGAKQLALLLEDPDAPGAAFTHWLAYELRPASVRLPQAIPPATRIPGPTPLLQGKNDFGGIGYGGPCPPKGETHTYVFRLLALDVELGLPAGADRATFDAAVEGHVLAEATLSAPFTRD
jgi:Raf kinase inhibitor-like YbhB/YbcL family protein